MTFTAARLSTLQACARSHAIEREYRYPRRRPRVLFETLLQAAVFQISNGTPVEAAADEATTRFLETAARPGLDTLHDPYCLARDLCACLQTVLEAISRTVLLTLKPVPATPGWQVTAFQDDSGLLHRWTVVDRWDDDARYRELHSWDVFGDCAAAQQGMWLHVVEIGSLRGGHQHTPWCRCYRHPAILGRYKFRKVDGSPLTGDWKPVWYQDSDKNNPKTWVDLMQQDGLELIHHLQVGEPLPEHVEQFKREIVAEYERAERLPSWERVPMSRKACDFPYTCPWQPVCYAPPGPVNIEALGGFEKIVK